MATDIRAATVPCVDAARQCVDDLGLRPEVVIIRTVEWSGVPGAGLPDNGYQHGAGTASILTDVTVAPAPVVSNPDSRLRAADPGKYAEGDRVVSKISRTYLETDFTDAPDGGSGEKRERYFLISGDPYRLVGDPEKRNFEWRLHLRRMRKRPAI